MAKTGLMTCLLYSTLFAALLLTSDAANANERKVKPFVSVVTHIATGSYFGVAVDHLCCICVYRFTLCTWETGPREIFLLKQPIIPCLQASLEGSFLSFY